MRNNKNDNWFRHNDHKCCTIPDISLIKDSPSLLLYKLVDEIETLQDEEIKEDDSKYIDNCVDLLFKHVRDIPDPMVDDFKLKLDLQAMTLN